MALPLVDSLRQSFYSFAENGDTVFVGFDNFRRLFGGVVYGARFWNAFKNNIYFFFLFMLI
jgi:raffinose/stachyose/melibiose transport system permease protein